MSSAKWNSCCLFGSGSDTFKSGLVFGFFLLFWFLFCLIIPGFFYKDVNDMLEFIIVALSHSMLEIFTVLAERGTPDPKLSSC